MTASDSTGTDVPPFEIQRLPFDEQGVESMQGLHPRLRHWPVVYTLDDGKDIYVGESLDAWSRMRQHLDNPAKEHLRAIKVVIDERYNKSVCLDLESHLIRWLAGDARLKVLNRNDGIVDADYYQRAMYRDTFAEIFEALRADGIFTKTIPQIENSDLFKLSPFKALTRDQEAAVYELAESLAQDRRTGQSSLSIVQGDPGTGKTIVAIYLIKLLRDIAQVRDGEEADPDSLYVELFAPGTRELFRDMRIGFVIPQQSLRKSVKRVFASIPGLQGVPVLSAYEVGEDSAGFDLLIVDEAHRLNQLAQQAHGTLLKKFKEIHSDLFGFVDETKNQLDWIRAKAQHVILMMDAKQTVRPADIPAAEWKPVIDEVKRDHRYHRLTSQMRVAGGNDYVAFIRKVLSDSPPTQMPDFGSYDLRLYDDMPALVRDIRAADNKAGLSRLVAGYAWDWLSRNDSEAFDIEIQGMQFQWNSTPTDWIYSPKSIDEVGSIHTVQGYDLNYTGVIIGPDLVVDPSTGKLAVVRKNYFDKAGKRNNRMRGQVTTDDDLLRYIVNVYAVLLTRGVRGTYVYVCDPELRKRFQRILGA